MIQRIKITISILFFVLPPLYGMPPFTLVETPDGYEFTLEVPEIEIEGIHVSEKLKNGKRLNQSFERVFIPGFMKAGSIGDAELLVGTFEMALDHESPVIRISDIQTTRIALSHQIYPKQQSTLMSSPISYNGSSIQKYFHYNPESFKKQPEVKPFIFVSDTYSFRGQKAATITCSPIQYDPTTNEMIVIKKITVQLQMKKPHSVRSWKSRAFNKIMRDIFVNLRLPCGRTVLSERYNEKEKYLILVSEKFKENQDLKKFIDFRKETGYDIELVDAKSVGSTKDDFKKYIRNKKPAFCLLVGANEDFPFHTEYIPFFPLNLNIRTYNYYFMADRSSPKIDIAYGLFCCNTEEGLKNLINKTISTEKNINSYPKHFLGFSGNSQKMQNLPANATDQLITCMYNDYFKPLNYKSTLIYRVDQPIGDKKNCIAALKEGVRFLNYNGHGTNGFWAYGNSMATTMGESDIKDLSNTIYPFVYSAACQTGTFASDTLCWAIITTNHKAMCSAFIGASNLSSIGQYCLNRGLYRAIIEKKITKYGLAFLSGLSYVPDTSAGMKFPDANLQKLIDTGSINMCIWQYHYFGDPAIETMSKPTHIDLPLIKVTETHAPSLTVTVTSGIFHFKYRGTLYGNMTFKLYDLYGRSVITDNFTKNNTIKSIKGQHIYSWKFNPYTNSLAAGMYMMEFKNGNHVFNKPIRYITH